MRAQVLVVDDKENMLKLFEKILGPHHTLTTASDGRQALSLIGSQSFDVIVTDVRMPGADGFEVLGMVKQVSPGTEVIMMTAHASVQKAVEAMKAGAYDYIQKPFEPDDVSRIVARALEHKRLCEQATTLRRQIDELVGFSGVVGRSQAMREVYVQVEQAAGLDITVLLTGESGTGKELIARAIHSLSQRKDNLLIPVNCGALPAELVESELFGHLRGAFTGATGNKRGLFEEAHLGTIFLDEIGDLPLPAQVKLTRVIQEREVRRVGDTRATKVDVRVVAATLRDLKADVLAGRFREDLYYRLNVFPIRLPPLRERREDIPILAGHFLGKYSRFYKRAISGIEPEAQRVLTQYGWPGNVRELENTIERAVAVCGSSQIAAQDLPLEIKAVQQGGLPSEFLVHLPYRDAMELSRDRTSHEYLMAIMREFRGNVTRAAERAGMERESLHRLLKRYHIRSDDFKRDEET